MSLAEVLASLSTCELLAVDFDATAAEELLSEEGVFVLKKLSQYSGRKSDGY